MKVKLLAAAAFALLAIQVSAQQFVEWHPRPQTMSSMELDGTMNPSVDTSNRDLIARVLMNGCLEYGGAGRLFGVVRLYQNGQMIASGDLYNCNTHKIGDWYNVMADKRDAAAIHTKKNQAQIAANEYRQQWLTKNGGATPLENSKLAANPFAYEGKNVALLLWFETMISRDTALFHLNDTYVVVSGIPDKKFVQRSLVVLAGKVMGKTTARLPLIGQVDVPQVKYLDAHFCNEKCVNYFGPQ